MIARLKSNLIRLAKNRILIGDGAYGTNLAAFLRREQYVDQLNMTNPEYVRKLSESYLLSGADLLSCNTLNCNTIQIKNPDDARSINEAAANIARQSIADKQRDAFCVGVIGPTTVNPGAIGTIEYDGMVSAYIEQMKTFLDAKCDLIRFETMINGATITAVSEATKAVVNDTRCTIPIWISLAPLGNDGRLLSGERIIDFLENNEFKVFTIIGFNCTDNVAVAEELFEALIAKSNVLTSFFPNAGLPNERGKYPLDSKGWVEMIEPLLIKGLLNIVGGCCGTGPEYIRRLKDTASRYSPRAIEIS